MLQTTVLMSSITDSQYTSVSVTSQQHSALYKTSTKAITSKCTPTSAVPVLSSSASAPYSGIPLIRTRHVPASLVAVSSCASTDIDSMPMLSGARVMSSSHPKFTGAASASTRAGSTFQSIVTRPVSTLADSTPSSESGLSSCGSAFSVDSGYFSPVPRCIPLPSTTKKQATFKLIPEVSLPTTSQSIVSSTTFQALPANQSSPSHMGNFPTQCSSLAVKGNTCACIVGIYTS